MLHPVEIGCCIIVQGARDLIQYRYRIQCRHTDRLHFRVGIFDWWWFSVSCYHTVSESCSRLLGLAQGSEQSFRLRHVGHVQWHLFSSGNTPPVYDRRPHGWSMPLSLPLVLGMIIYCSPFWLVFPTFARLDNVTNPGWGVGSSLPGTTLCLACIHTLSPIFRHLIGCAMIGTCFVVHSL